MINNQDPGELDHELVLHAPLIAPDAVCSPAPREWVEMATEWGAVVEMPGQTLDGMGQPVAMTNLRAKIRYRSDVTAAWQVLIDGTRWCHIESLNVMGLRKEWLVLMLREWAPGTAPTITRATSAGDDRETAAGDERLVGQP